MFLELALGIFKRTRFLFALIAAGAAGVAIVTNNNTAYVICIIFIALTIASDATVMVLSRKLNIPIKYRENYSDSARTKRIRNNAEDTGIYKKSRTGF